MQKESSTATQQDTPSRSISLSDRIKIVSFHLDGLSDEQIGDAFNLTASEVLDIRTGNVSIVITDKLLTAMAQEEIDIRKPVITTEEKIHKIIHETEIPPNEPLDLYTRLEAEVGISRESALHWMRRIQVERRAERNPTAT